MPLKWERAKFGDTVWANLVKGLTLTVAYDTLLPRSHTGNRYTVIVFNVMEPLRFASLEDGKARAILRAKERLTEALKALEE